MNKGNLILKSRSFFTGLKNEPESAAIVIDKNKIKAIVPFEEVAKYNIEGTKVYDFGDKLIMPGFIDAHVHYFMGSVVASKFMCKELFSSTSEKEAISIVKKFADANPDESCIRGMGWFPANWDDAPLPTCKSLDVVFPDKPVYLLCADGHTFWTNTKGLEEAGITRDTKVSGGEIGKFPDGSLNGLLFEPEAYGPVMDKMMEMSLEQKIACQKDFFHFLNEKGITSVSDMSAMQVCEETVTAIKTIKDLEAKQELSVRVNIYPALGTEGNYKDVLELQKSFCSDKLKIGGLKSFVDGVTSTYTGYLLEPYEDKNDTKSNSIHSEEIYEKCVINANKEGLGVRLHAVSDGAVRLALDTFEKSNTINDNIGNHKKIRNSIEHIECIHPKDIIRFNELGVIASMQPYHLTLDQNEQLQRLGAERCKFQWPHRSMIDNGVTLAFGSDFPVVDASPFIELYSAVSRCDDAGTPTGVNPNEKIKLAEAIKAYTMGSAYAYGRENELGTLESEKFADIVVLNKNLFDLPDSEILNCEVEMTIMDGKIVYEKI